MTDNKNGKTFPADFPVGVPPKGAREESVSVYRICRTGAVDAQSFLPTYLEPATKENRNAPHDCGYYSMSTFEKENEAQKTLRFLRKYNPPAILAKGVTAPECGWILRDREMPDIEELEECIRDKNMKKLKKTSHVHWWLYERAEPHQFFQPIEKKEEST